MANPYSYSIFFDFIESYQPSGFLNIKTDDPIILELEQLMEVNDQYFQVFDLGQMRFLYTSKGITKIVGVTPQEINPGHYTQIVHPEDEERLGLVRTLVYKMEKEIFQAKKGSALASYNIRFYYPEDVLINLFAQDYMFYSSVPYKAVFMIQVVTKIDWFQFRKNKFHHYAGKNISLFKFPDHELLSLGPDLSHREYEIIRLIESGLCSKEIADKLHISVHTVNTHRSNMLEKAGKPLISELIYDLKEKGLL
ncbi:MAG: LuxR C-terminal-related transcriptional regulator [Mariniphaga sp.]